MAESFKEVARGYGLEVQALDDWSCCGSSPAHSTDHEMALLLAARNLLLAEAQGAEELMVLCPSCFVRLREAERTIVEDEGEAQKVQRSLGGRYQGKVRLKFFLETMKELGLEKLKAGVKVPLQGLKGALYYGCLLSRPEWITGFDVAPYEAFLEDLFRALGGDVVHWGYSRQCCGAHLAMTKADLVNGLVDRIRDHARRAGANCLVVFCPLCQVNLEMRGRDQEALPVLYISEVMGLAAGLPQTRSWLARHLIDPQPLLASLKIA
jgi:heterodisulfide reductase subunit B